VGKRKSSLIRKPKQDQRVIILFLPFYQCSLCVLEKVAWLLLCPVNIRYHILCTCPVCPICWHCKHSRKIVSFTGHRCSNEAVGIHLVQLSLTAKANDNITCFPLEFIESLMLKRCCCLTQKIFWVFQEDVIQLNRPQFDQKDLDLHHKWEHPRSMACGSMSVCFHHAPFHKDHWKSHCQMGWPLAASLKCWFYKRNIAEVTLQKRRCQDP